MTIFQSLQPYFWPKFDVMIFHHFSKAIALIFDQIWPKDLWPFFQAYNLSFDFWPKPLTFFHHN